MIWPWALWEGAQPIHADVHTDVHSDIHTDVHSDVHSDIPPHADAPHSDIHADAPVPIDLAALRAELEAIQAAAVDLPNSKRTSPLRAIILSSAELALQILDGG